LRADDPGTFFDAILRHTTSVKFVDLSQQLFNGAPDPAAVDFLPDGPALEQQSYSFFHGGIFRRLQLIETVQDDFDFLFRHGASRCARPGSSSLGSPEPAEAVSARPGCDPWRDHRS